ncbi:hypothetical protein Q5752_000250 [Cryptotrichosporon argae]
MSAPSESSPLLPAPATESEAPPKRSLFRRPLASAFGTFTSVPATTVKLVTTYALLLAVGAGIGVGVTKGYEHYRATKDGPLMVPPVYTLPPPTGLPRNPAYLVNGTHASVATEDITCSTLGLAILRDHNGTAADAAITSALCIGLLNAFSSGIGGGGFAIVRAPDADGVSAIDFRETAPNAARSDMFKTAGRAAAQVGGLSVGVPGELRGLEQVHRLYGTLPLRTLVQPLVDLSAGWRVSRELARRIRIFGGFMRADPVWAAVYAPRGELLVEGDWVARPTYGRTLARIADEGWGALYEGDMARDLVQTIKEQGGIMTEDDLRNYRARVYPAIEGTWRNQTVYTTDAPSSGPILLSLLNMLEPFDLAALDKTDAAHLFIEAMKFAFGARSEVTDPAPEFGGNLTRFEEFRSKAWASAQRLRITNVTHGVDYYGLQYDTPVDHGTTHLSIVDRWGGAVTLTSTVNLIWGSHVMCPRTGVILNDELDDFSVPGQPDAFGLLPSPWNYPAPNKRPLSSTAPAILVGPDRLLALGSSGGSRIFPSVAATILHLFPDAPLSPAELATLEATLDPSLAHLASALADPARPATLRALDLSAAIERPRWHNQLSPGITTLEAGGGADAPDPAVLDQLEHRGHEIGLFDINVGASEVQAVLVEYGAHGKTVYGASDSRKNGIATAY